MYRSLFHNELNHQLKFNSQHYCQYEKSLLNQSYVATEAVTMYTRDIRAIFNRIEDAQAVIDNPNFREILDTIYKD